MKNTMESTDKQKFTPNMYYKYIGKECEEFIVGGSYKHFGNNLFVGRYCIAQRVDPSIDLHSLFDVNSGE